jgi:hypothetical protein
MFRFIYDRECANLTDFFVKFLLVIRRFCRLQKGRQLLSQKSVLKKSRKLVPKKSYDWARNGEPKILDLNLAGNLSLAFFLGSKLCFGIGTIFLGEV